MMNGPGINVHVRYTAIVKLTAVLALLVSLAACSSTPSWAPGNEEVQEKFNQEAYNAALELMKQKKYSDAAASLEKVVRDSGKRAGPYINLGIAYKELGRFDDAKRALVTATKIDRKSAIAFNELGLVHRRLGEFADARIAYKKSISNRSGYGLPYLNLGILCDIYLQDMSCAISNYKKYQSLTNSKDQKVTLWIADLKNRMNKKSQR